MRIAYVCADRGVPVFGQKGCSIHVKEFIRALIRQGLEVDLFAERIGGRLPIGLEKTRLHKLPPLPTNEDTIYEQDAVSFNKDLRIALEDEGAFDLVYERYSLWSFAAMEYAQQNAIPGLLEVNAPLIEEQTRYRGFTDRRGAELVAKKVFGAASALIAVSDEIAAYLKRHPSVSFSDRVHVVPNGVNPKRFLQDLKPSCPVARDIFTIGFVGSLKPWHGLSELVEAFALLHKNNPNTRLLIVGDGTQWAELAENLTARDLLQAVRLTGAVPPEKVPGFLASMDVAVAPYPALSEFYFSPLKVYEYMAAGLPVVASNIGQLKQLIVHGENGLLCPPGDSSALVQALEHLRRDPQLCRRLGQAARSTVLQRYTWDRIVQRILQIAEHTCSINSHYEGNQKEVI